MEIKHNKLCEICNQLATSLCFKCINYYCESCFKFVHEKEINKGHHKDNINNFLPIDLKCPDHPKIPMNLFCIDEKGKIIFMIIILINQSFFVQFVII